MSESVPAMSVQTRTEPIGETFLDKAKRKTIEEPLVPVGSCFTSTLALNLIKIDIFFCQAVH
jgi:hypothetical protein